MEAFVRLGAAAMLVLVGTFIPTRSQAQECSFLGASSGNVDIRLCEDFSSGNLPDWNGYERYINDVFWEGVPGDHVGSLFPGTVTTAMALSRGEFGVYTCIETNEQSEYFEFGAQARPYGVLSPGIKSLVRLETFAERDCYRGVPTSMQQVERIPVEGWNSLIGTVYSPPGTKLIRLSLMMSNPSPQPGNMEGLATAFDNAYIISNESCASDSAHCFQNGRFKAEIKWENFSGQTGTAKISPKTGQTGAFWFFDPENEEVFVKILNACGLNGKYWIFIAGLTDVKTTVTIEDLITGQIREFVNPLGTLFQPIAATIENAFDCAQ